MPNVQQHATKKDRYSRVRGTSTFLDIFCVCGAHIALYQKDGPGALLRMYLDRIFEPSELSSLNEMMQTVHSLPVIRCSECGGVIATPMVYKPERRLAFRIKKGSIRKVASDGTYPPTTA